MFVTWALTGPDDEAAFRSGYGRLDLDPLVLTYYRYERLVADLAEFADVVLRRADVDDAARHRE